MLRKEETSSLDDFVKDFYITVSDKVLLGLISKNEDLTILQSMDSFNWYENRGKTQHLVGKKDLSGISRLEESLDLFLVDFEKLKGTENSYRISADLYAGELSKKDIEPNLCSIGLSFYKEGKKIDLRDYSLLKTDRYLEYPNLKRGSQNFNKSIRARFYDNVEKTGLTIVYRMTITNNKVIGSRLYEVENGTLKNLDRSKNDGLIRFMRAVDYWHDNELIEKESKLEKLGFGDNLPSYLSMYS